jgi:hypothetical protein
MASTGADGSRGTTPASRGRPLGAHLLGIFVIAHLAAVVLQGIPDPGVGLKRSAWSDKTVEQEFRVWASFFSRFGAEVTVEELQDRIWSIAKGFTDFRSALVRPFRPYRDYIGVRQPWRMFVAPHRFPTALVIDVHEEDEWRIVYADRSPEHTWRVGTFGHDRMRAAIFRYGWPSYRRIYGDFGHWVAGLAATDFPEARYVRLRMFRRRTPSPEEVRAGDIPPGEFQQQILLALERFR